MKTLLSGILILLVVSVIASTNSAQEQCGTLDVPVGSLPYPNNFFGSYYKPHRTDLNNGNASPPEASLHMLFVFIQFPDEISQSVEWPLDSAPVFMNKFLSEEKNEQGNFWDRYPDSSLSDYYQEVSRGAFHVTGQSRHMVVSRSLSFYRDTLNGHITLMAEIYNRLKMDSTIRWTMLDRWSRNNLTNNYVYSKDKYLDMMGIFVRHDYITTNYFGYSGAVPLGPPNNFILKLLGSDTIRISAERSDMGSGFWVVGSKSQGPLNYAKAFGVTIHEYGHYLFANNHSTSGIMTSNDGISINDLFMSGFEKYKLGYLADSIVDYGTGFSFNLGDASGRSGTPHLLRLPISGIEFFIIENRRKISRYDNYLLGDTSQNNPFRSTGDYGKGVYIYHSNSVNLDYAGLVDIECADGLWNWGNFGYSHPDWSNSDTVAVKLRSSIPVIVQNDIDSSYFPFTKYYNADGISAGPWFGIGKQHLSLGLAGTDKIYTNAEEYWTSRERFGDRWDAWNVGFNEIFSPYSNPNTRSLSNSNTGIYVYYYQLDGDIARLKIFKAGFNGMTDSSILAITPPSRPMGLTLDYYVETENITHPMITWSHNKEPDMLRTDAKKKYRIWRATYTNMNYVPVGYLLIDSVLIDSGTVPTYIDTTIYGMGTYWAGFGDQVQYPVRYEVEAVDKYEDRSVMSDFASGVCVRGTVNADPIGPDSPENEKNIPENFALYQNSPNPFNPVTNIEYDLPVDGNIELKIYDIAGRLIKTLVNEFKTAGSYLVSFNASDLSSGVYFYSLYVDGKHIGVKRMALVK